jgi:hypothetical protein
MAAAGACSPSSDEASMSKVAKAGLSAEPDIRAIFAPYCLALSIPPARVNERKSTPPNKYLALILKTPRALEFLFRFFGGSNI